MSPSNVSTRGVDETSPPLLKHGFTPDEWCRLTAPERAAIEYWLDNAPAGCTPADVRDQLDESGEVPVWAIPIFILYLEFKMRECVGAPFGFTADQWAYLNRYREAKGQPWFTAEEWAARPPNRRLDECLNLPKKAPAAEQAAAVFQVGPSVLPNARVSPRELSLTNLWAARKRGGAVLEQQLMETNDNVTLIVSGPSLSQYDHGVFMEIVRLARGRVLARCSIRDFVADLLPKPSLKGENRRKRAGRRRPVQSMGGNTERCAAEALERLSRCHIDLTVRGPDKLPMYSFVGRLIDKLTWDDGEKVLSFEASLDPAISVLFEGNRFTFHNPNVRCRLGHSPLALWLYGFVKCHNLRFPFDLKYLQRLSGCESEPGEFRRLLRVAVNKLKKEKILYTARRKNGKLAMYKKKLAPATKARRARPRQPDGVQS